MGEDQFYNPVSGVNHMVSDIESFINPMVFKLQPLMRVMGMINVFLVIVVFIAFIIYLKYVRKHKMLDKLLNTKTYIFAGIMLAVYVFLTEAPIKLGPYMNLNLGIFIMPIFAKKMGPMLACVFGMLQYAISFLMHPGESFDLSTLLLASISGMIYARFMYMRRTTYIRCLIAKFAVNMVCNVIFVPMVTGDVMTVELANLITRNIVSNIVLAPLQALVIYAALISYKKVKRAISEN